MGAGGVGTGGQDVPSGSGGGHGDGAVDMMATTDASPTDDTGAAGDDAPPAAGAPTFVAVGYGGVRVRSLDGGKTWIDSQRLGGGGDDNFLLRSIAFGNGLFVALGWQTQTSPDGKTWTTRTTSVGQWMGGVRFGNGRFVAAGGYGASMYSPDGVTWMNGSRRMTDPARSVAFGNGLWVARADSNHWWQTSSGETWMDLGGAHTDAVVFCGGQFVDAAACTTPVGRDGGRTAFGSGVWIGIRGGKVERSTDGGMTWTPVYTASDPLEDVAFGYVAP
ncbi:MAG: hypothetical protein QOI66_582 [Myxococcales bacterium]|nr:hypothetical protein [Myxococcales bacterium]